MRFLIALLAALVLLPAANASAELQRPYTEQIHADTECPDGGGTCTIDTDIYLADGASRFQLWHERGHLFDTQVLTDDQRAWFTARLRMTGPWDQGTGMGTRGPSEVFADAYASCAVGKRAVRRESAWVASESEVAYGYEAGPRRHRRICTAIQVLTLVTLRAQSGSAG